MRQAPNESIIEPLKFYLFQRRTWSGRSKGRKNMWLRSGNFFSRLCQSIDLELVQLKLPGHMEPPDRFQHRQVCRYL